MMDEVDEAEALNVVAEHICMWYLQCNAMHRSGALWLSAVFCARHMVQ